MLPMISDSSTGLINDPVKISLLTYACFMSSFFSLINLAFPKITSAYTSLNGLLMVVYKNDEIFP